MRITTEASGSPRDAFPHRQQRERDVGNDILPVRGACDVTIEFTHASAGEASDQLSVTDNAASSTQTLPLSGNGVPSTTTPTATSTYSAVTQQTTVP
jgi:hypothetical protein